jgi:hypothetical protein
VVARCLEKERAQRFQTVGELAVALQRFGTPRARISVEGIVGTLQRAGIMSFAPEQTRDAGGIAIAATAASLPGPHTDASWGQTASRKASGGKAFAAVVGVATAGMIALGVSFAVHKAPDSTASGGGELPSASSPLAASSAAPVVTAAATVVPSAPSPVASAQPSAAPAETTHAQSIAPRAPKASAPASTKPAAASPSAATPASAAPDCNPRYYYDANGGKHYKPECFGK